MTETKKRKVHTPEFKAKVGLEALRGMKTINEIGQAADGPVGNRTSGQRLSQTD